MEAPVLVSDTRTDCGRLLPASVLPIGLCAVCLLLQITYSIASGISNFRLIGRTHFIYSAVF